MALAAVAPQLARPGGNCLTSLKKIIGGAARGPRPPEDYQLLERWRSERELRRRRHGWTTENT